jgi:hypothetical protein
MTESTKRKKERKEEKKENKRKHDAGREEEETPDQFVFALTVFYHCVLTSILL